MGTYLLPSARHTRALVATVNMISHVTDATETDRIITETML